MLLPASTALHPIHIASALLRADRSPSRGRSVILRQDECETALAWNRHGRFRDIGLRLPCEQALAACSRGAQKQKYPESFQGLLPAEQFCSQQQDCRKRDRTTQSLRPAARAAA